MTISSQIEARLHAALAAFPDAAARVQPATDPRFGDYQTNIAMILAKQQRANPRQLAQEIIGKIDLAEMCEPPEIAGAGFINFRLKPAWLAERFAALAADEKLGVPSPDAPKKFVIDFSSPNVAKPMHVGHIRSTILGDALARIAAFIGHSVVRDNHIGDWGTQFGMLLVGWNNFYERRNAAKKPIEELVRIYKLTNLACAIPRSAPIRQVLSKLEDEKSEFRANWDKWRKLKPDAFNSEFQNEPLESDFRAADVNCLRATICLLKKYGYLSKQSPNLIRKQSTNGVLKAIQLAESPPFGTESVKDAAKKELVKLQQGDPENRAIWEDMIHLSKRQFDWIYERLDVRFDFTLGESFYNPWLKEVVQQLREKDIARASDGAMCVFSDHTGPEKDDPFLIQRDSQWGDIPALVQKADGAANYTTTDLATLDYRLREWAPDEIIYVTDGRQQHHFRQVFAIFRRWQPGCAVKLTHVWFGSILGDDGKPFKTRSGETIKLAGLLDEAEKRAFAIVTGKNPTLPEAERREIARIIGLGAVKYADLLPNRQSDYVFSWDKMLALTGNTAPYLQYSYVRIRSIFRKADIDPSAICHSPSAIILTEIAELLLAKKLFHFGEVLPQVLEDFRPNVLCNYLYELASTFHSFFEACPVLKSEGATRATRLTLCAVTARTLHRGLGLLGIEVPERM